MEATLSKSQIDTKTFITCVNTKKKKIMWSPNYKHDAIHKICKNLEAFGYIVHSMTAPTAYGRSQARG